MSFRRDVDVAWALAVFRQLCGGSSTLTVEPLSRAIRDMMQGEFAESPQALAVQLLNTMDTDQNGMVTFDEFLALSETNSDLFDQLMGGLASNMSRGDDADSDFPPSPQQFASHSNNNSTIGSAYPRKAEYQDTRTNHHDQEVIQQLKEYIVSLERELHQSQHEKALLQTTMQTQLADTEGDVSELVRGVQQKDEMIKLLKEDNARLRAECDTIPELQSTNHNLSERVERIQAQLNEHISSNDASGRRASASTNLQVQRLENEAQSLRVMAEQRETELLADLKSTEIRLQIALANCRTKDVSFGLLQSEMIKMREKVDENDFLRQRLAELKDLLDEKHSISEPHTATSTFEELQEGHSNSPGSHHGQPSSASNRLHSRIGLSSKRSSSISSDIHDGVQPADVPSLAENVGYDMLCLEMQDLKLAHAKEVSSLKFNIECLEMKLIALQRQLVEQVTYVTNLEQDYRQLKLQSDALGVALDKAKAMIDTKSIFQKFSLFGSSRSAPTAVSPRSAHRTVPANQASHSATPTPNSLVTSTAAVETPSASVPVTSDSSVSIKEPSIEVAIRGSETPIKVGQPVDDNLCRPHEHKRPSLGLASEDSTTDVPEVSLLAPPEVTAKSPQPSKRASSPAVERKQALTGLSGLLSRFTRKNTAPTVLQSPTQQPAATQGESGPTEMTIIKSARNSDASPTQATAQIAEE